MLAPIQPQMPNLNPEAHVHVSKYYLHSTDTLHSHHHSSGLGFILISNNFPAIMAVQKPFQGSLVQCCAARQPLRCELPSLVQPLTLKPNDHFNSNMVDYFIAGPFSRNISLLWDRIEGHHFTPLPHIPLRSLRGINPQALTPSS